MAWVGERISKIEKKDAGALIMAGIFLVIVWKFTKGS
tara:strand:+ start:77 stop:187 length:111 start_codon:yes stop_codon:yes gene_type:complete